MYKVTLLAQGGHMNITHHDTLEDATDYLKREGKLGTLKARLAMVTFPEKEDKKA